MECPNCSENVADGAPDCPSCGIIFDKLEERERRNKRQAIAGLAASDAGFRVQINPWIIRIGVGVVLVAIWAGMMTCMTKSYVHPRRSGPVKGKSLVVPPATPGIPGMPQ